MLLRVNPVAGVWGFKSRLNPDYELWFTSADPKPQDISVEELPQDMKNALVGALRTKVLIEVDEKGEVLRKTILKQVQLPVAELNINPELEKRAKELLESGVTSIRREVSIIRDSLYLSTAIAIEKSGKNRKTVIDLLEKQLIKAVDLSSPAKMPIMYDNLVEEEEGETVVIKTQDLTIEQELLTQEEVEEVQDRLEEIEQEGG